MSRRSQSLPTCLLAVPALLLLAGCGSGSGDGAASPPPSAALSTPPQTAAPAPAAASPRPRPSSAPPRTPAPASPSPSAPSLPPGTPAPCATNALRISLGAGEGAAGSTVVALQFRNSGPAACSLTGHPGVSFVAGEDGHRVGAAAGSTGPAAPVVLRPGQSAHASLRISNPANRPAETCRPVPVRGLRVYPPDSRAAVFLPMAQSACSDPQVVGLQVTAVAAG